MTVRVSPQQDGYDYFLEEDSDGPVELEDAEWLAYQLYESQRMLWDSRIRYMLADLKAE